MEITMSWPAAASPMSSSDMWQTVSSVSAAGTEEYRCLCRYVVSAAEPLSAKGVISSQFINHIESTLGWFDGKAARLDHTYLISFWASTLVCLPSQEYWYQPQFHQSNGQDKTAPKYGVHLASQKLWVFLVCVLCKILTWRVQIMDAPILNFTTDRDSRLFRMTSAIVNAIPMVWS